MMHDTQGGELVEWNCKPGLARWIIASLSVFFILACVAGCMAGAE